jgi:hypothetical protein
VYALNVGHYKLQQQRATIKLTSSGILGLAPASSKHFMREGEPSFAAYITVVKPLLSTKFTSAPACVNE